jgi:DNA-binding GntR family transcriptional regulator
MPLAEYRGPLRRPPLRFEAYDVLLEAIVRGDLAPGEQIRDVELADRMGLSRTPVREAISRLVDVGLAEAKPGVHTRITVPTRTDVVATVEVLQALDAIALRAAVPRLTPATLERLSEANRRFENAVGSSDPTAALAADDAFHGILVEIARNPVVARLLPQLHPQIHRVLYHKFSSVLGGRETVEHHDRLVARCAAGDADGAVELSATHWARLAGLLDDLFPPAEGADARATGGACGERDLRTVRRQYPA